MIANPAGTVGADGYPRRKLGSSRAMVAGILCCCLFRAGEPGVTGTPGLACLVFLSGLRAGWGGWSG
jgi:hypothetical protein